MTLPTIARIVCSLSLLMGWASPLLAQPASGLRLAGVLPSGVRASVTESEGVISFAITNNEETDRQLRVVVFYPSQPESQWARDVWVPAKSTLNTWMPIGPAPASELNAEKKGEQTQGRTVEFVFIDRTSGRDVVLLPNTDERVRSRLVPYRKREFTTVLCADLLPNPMPPETFPSKLTAADEAMLFARAFREASGLSYHVAVLPDDTITPIPESFAGIDQFILAHSRLRADTPGLMALRQWVQQGGKLWIRLDLVDPDVVAAILGDDLSFSVVDRVPLNAFQVIRSRDGSVVAPMRQLDTPVEMVRVALAGNETVLHTVNGWPVSFAQSIGKGRVVCTTLGARGWLRDRERNEPRSRFREMPDLPVRFDHLDQVAFELRPTSTTAFSLDDFRPLLTEEIGYQIMSQRTAGLLLLSFVLGLVGVALWVRRSGRGERFGWAGPMLAVVVAVAFVVQGMQSRQAVPPTTAAVQMVNAAPGSGEASVSGLFGMYRPTSGEVALSSGQIGKLDLDTSGLEGQTRRRIYTDVGGWHWEQLAFPAGVRTGPYQLTTRSGPIRTTARFTERGLEGRAQWGPYLEPRDAMIIGLAREPMGVRIEADHTFRSGPDEEFGQGQFISGTVLTDQQQRRQAIYQKLLTSPTPDFLDERINLFAWVKADKVPFQTGQEGRESVTTLLHVPVTLERTPAKSNVRIPRSFIPYRRVNDGRLTQPTLEAAANIRMEMRFQLPSTVLPMSITKATVVARVSAAGRALVVSGMDGQQLSTLKVTDSPTDPVRVEISDPKFLTLDAQGGWHVHLSLGGPSSALNQDPNSRWQIHSLTVEIQGQTK